MVDVWEECDKESVEKAKAKLRELFEELIDYLVETKVRSVAVYIEWDNGMPSKIEFEGNAGVCECGGWATYCEGCYEHAIDEAKYPLEREIYELRARVEELENDVWRLERELEEARRESDTLW